MAFIGNSYHHTIYDNKTFVRTIDLVSRRLKDLARKHPFDAIAFSGSSGAAFAYPLSAIDGYSIIYVRKPNETSHGRPVEGPEKFIGTYIILDDFIESGNTVKRIIKVLVGMKCVGVLLYKRDVDDVIKVDSKVYTVWGTPGVYDNFY